MSNEETRRPEEDEETGLYVISVAEIHKISLQTYLVAVADVVHARDKIFKLKQQFHFANLFLEQPLNFV